MPPAVCPCARLLESFGQGGSRGDEAPQGRALGDAHAPKQLEELVVEVEGVGDHFSFFALLGESQMNT